MVDSTVRATGMDGITFTYQFVVRRGDKAPTVADFDEILFPAFIQEGYVAEKMYPVLDSPTVVYLSKDEWTPKDEN